jgi:hypothetical protein
LPHMATRAIVTVIFPHMARHQPLHPASQITILARSGDQVKIIWHQTKRQQPLGSLAQQFQKRRVILRSMEDLISPVTTIQEVNTDPSGRCSYGPRRGPDVNLPALRSSIKVESRRSSRLFGAIVVQGVRVELRQTSGHECCR